MNGEFVGRWVAFLITPLITLVSGFIALKANAWFGLNLAPAEVAAYVGGIVLSIGTAAGVWLHSRGKYEIAKATGIDDEKIDLIAHAVAERLPKPPQAPAPVSQHHPRAPGG